MDVVRTVPPHDPGLACNTRILMCLPPPSRPSAGTRRSHSLQPWPQASELLLDSTLKQHEATLGQHERALARHKALMEQQLATQRETVQQANAEIERLQKEPREVVCRMRTAPPGGLLL